MTKKQVPEKQKTLKVTESSSQALKPRQGSAEKKKEEGQVHLLGKGRVCNTEARGHASPQGDSRIKIVVDASEGFIPLWAKSTILKWRFRERSMDYFENPEEAKEEIRALLGEALLAWGDAAPVKFKEDTDVYDFEIVMKNSDDCNDSGCTLASAFFPDSGRHQLELYPMLFEQSKKEQIDTLVHEIGHVFGLRHFFAKLQETKWASEIFGTHSKFSIMNYGSLSTLTKEDRADLKQLYKLVWSGQLTEINKTPVRLVKPYHTLAFFTPESFALAPAALIMQKHQE